MTPPGTDHRRPPPPPRHLVRALRNREVSSRELLEAYLHRIDECEPRAQRGRDPRRRRAPVPRPPPPTGPPPADTTIGALHGLPITIKDSFETAGHAHHRRRAGPRRLRARPRRRRRRPARAGRRRSIFGKTNLPVFAMDWQTTNPVFGTTNNPWDLDPDARRLVRRSGGRRRRRADRPRARQRHPRLAAPARRTTSGVFALKPSFGLVPVRGHIPGPPGTLSAPDMAVAGPIARSADDLDLALDVLAGPGRGDGDRLAAAAARAARPVAARLPDRGVARRPGVPGRRAPSSRC